MIKLYVDFVSEDESLAITVDKSSIKFNLAELGNDLDHRTHVCAIGKYVCLFVRKRNGQPQMFFFDFRKNTAVIRELLLLLENHRAIRHKFVSLMELWNSDYDQGDELLQLVMGQPALTE